ncbi:hypothetical protein RE428_45150 [Marinobacter nanhaiticus D15-8W]|nr:DUF945 family protein [Marinobacter nanhaiticus]BES73497.1 hypothetical protein RE428_45150 [Marinobacter nanhaiticus D15-8W]
MKKWILAGAVVLVVVVAAPYGVGVLTEQYWSQATQQLNSEQPFLQVVTEEYDRGFFGGDIAGEIRVTDPETGDTWPIGFDGEVSHGVLGSEVTLTPVVEDDEGLQRLFPEESPKLTLSTWLWGTLEADLNVPAINVEDDDTGETLNAAEAYGWAKISDAGDHVELQLNWPGAVVRSETVKMSFDNLQLAQEADRISGNLWSGEGEMTLDSAEFLETDQTAVTLENLKLTGQTTPDDDSTHLSSHSELTLDNVKVNDETYGPHRIVMDIGNLDVAAWTEFQEVAADIQAMKTQMDPTLSGQEMYQQQMIMMQRFSQAAKNVAAAGLTIGMPEIDMQAPSGGITGHWELSHPTVPENERAQMPLIVQQLRGELALAVPVALFESRPGLAQDMEGLVQQGFLVRDGDVYRIDAKLADMTLKVNEQAFPVPPLI